MGDALAQQRLAVHLDGGEVAEEDGHVRTARLPGTPSPSTTQAGPSSASSAASRIATTRASCCRISSAFSGQSESSRSTAIAPAASRCAER